MSVSKLRGENATPSPHGPRCRYHNCSKTIVVPTVEQKEKIREAILRELARGSFHRVCLLDSIEERGRACASLPKWDRCAVYEEVQMLSVLRKVREDSDGWLELVPGPAPKTTTETK